MFEGFLKHIGVGWDANPPGIGSGRYPHGSGENPNQHLENMTLAQRKAALEKKYGPGNGQRIALELGYKTTTELRNAIKREHAVKMQENYKQIRELYSRGVTSPTRISELTGIGASTVRNYIKNMGNETKYERQERIKNELKALVEENKYIDVSLGAEFSLGVSETEKNSIIAQLQDEGYTVLTYRQRQVMNPRQQTPINVLCPPGTTMKDLVADIKNSDHEVIMPIDKSIINEDGEKSIFGLPPVNSIDSSRLLIKYDEDGGTMKDGVIEIRRGLDDLNLGRARYAQVRIGVDGKYYMKGMCIYGDDKDFPPGVDIIFNSSKPKELGMDNALKAMKKDPLTGEVDQDNPFGAAVKREENLRMVMRYYIDPKTGEKKVSPINVVNEEGDWEKWSKNTPSQMLSKQSETVIKEQLDLAYMRKVSEFEDIKSISNNTVKRVMLENFSQTCDGDAVDLKGAEFPRQQTHVILPCNSLKEGTIYAPNYNQGEDVFLIRYPHQGLFEIPRLKVDNTNAEGKKVIGNAPDAVGINHATANQLSGADYDGDNVSVIPYVTIPGSRKYSAISTEKAIKELVEIDLKKIYANSPDKPKVKDTSFDTQMEMGKISNLITDMTLKGAPTVETIRAVKHAMVIIDAEKHNLDWKQSEIDNDIKALKKKWQGSEDAGASTLISRASSIAYKDEERLTYRIDENTGEKITLKTGRTEPVRRLVKDKNGNRVLDENGKPVYENVIEKRTSKIDEKTGQPVYKTVPGRYNPSLLDEKDENGDPLYRIKRKEVQVKTSKMALTDDAYTLTSSGDREHALPKEALYANYANDLKALANNARLEYSKTSPSRIDRNAAKAYAVETQELENLYLDISRNAPRERIAQHRAAQNYKAKVSEYRNLTKDEMKRVRQQCIAEARSVVDAKSNKLTITPKQWEALEHNVISGEKAERIIKKVDKKDVLSYAIPKDKTELSPAKQNLIKAYDSKGYTNAQIAEMLGISTSTVHKYL